MSLFGRALSPFDFVDGRDATVAIVRFGAAGDVIRTAPAIEAVAMAWPHAKRIVVTHARNAPLIRRCRVPFDYVAFEPGQNLRSLAQALKGKGVTHLLDLHGTLRSLALTAWLWPRPHVRIFKRGFVEWARVELGHAPHRPQLTCAERQRQAIARLTGKEVVMPPLALKRPLRAAPNLVPTKAVGLSPGANWATKRWPAERWGELARVLVSRGYEVSVFGSRPEGELVETICRAAPRAKAQIGLSWDAFAQAICEQSCFVSGDSGPLHLAMGLGVSSVGIFQSTPHEAFDAPATKIVRGEASCRPCSFYGRRACPREHGDCWQSISVAMVLRAIEHCF